jgi:hypothetical protein
LHWRFGLARRSRIVRVYFHKSRVSPLTERSGTSTLSTISFTKSGGAFYVQQQQQASSRCHKFSKSNTLSDKEYTSAC